MKTIRQVLLASSTPKLNPTQLAAGREWLWAAMDDMSPADIRETMGKPGSKHDLMMEAQDMPDDDLATMYFEEFVQVLRDHMKGRNIDMEEAEDYVRETGWYEELWDDSDVRALALRTLGIMRVVK